MKKATGFSLVIASLTMVTMIGCASSETRIEGKSARVPANDGNQPSLRALFLDRAVDLRWKGESFCSGLLIRPSQVLTAAHCLRKFRTKREADVQSSLDLWVNGRSIKSAPVRFYYSSEFEFDEPRPKDTSGDIAIIMIGRAPVEPLAFSIGKFAETESSRYLTVGFGPNPDLSKSRAKGDLFEMNVTELDADLELMHSRLTFKSGPVGQGMICPGDSGSPLFKFRADGIELIGVLSASMVDTTDQPPHSQRPKIQRKDKWRLECSSQVGVAIFTDADAYRDFIQDPMQHGKRLKLRTH